MEIHDRWVSLGFLVLLSATLLISHFFAQAGG